MRNVLWCCDTKFLKLRLPMLLKVIIKERSFLLCHLSFHLLTLTLKQNQQELLNHSPHPELQVRVEECTPDGRDLGFGWCKAGSKGCAACRRDLTVASAWPRWKAEGCGLIAFVLRSAHRKEGLENPKACNSQSPAPQVPGCRSPLQPPWGHSPLLLVSVFSLVQKMPLARWFTHTVVATGAQWLPRDSDMCQ